MTDDQSSTPGKNPARRAEHTEELRVPFHDCDPLFVVWHGHYYKYFEVARTALLKSLVLDIPDIQALGYRMYVTETRCRYLAPLAYDDVFHVTARVSRTTPLIRISYTIRNTTTGRNAARGYTELATTDANGALIHRTPDDLLRRLDDHG